MSPSAQALQNSDVSNRSGGAVAPALARAAVPRVMVRSGLAENLSIDQVQLGQTTIDRLRIQGVSATVSSGTTRLENVEVALRIRIRVSLRVFRIGGSRTLTFRFPTVPIGDISIPELDDIRLNVGSAVSEDARLEVQPINNLDLGGARFTDLRADGTVLPAAGFALDGLALEGFSIDDISVPATFTEAIRVGSFVPNAPLQVPSVVATDISLPDVSAPRVSSASPVFIPSIFPESFSLRRRIGIGPARITLTVRPLLDMRIAALTLDDITASSFIDRIAVEDIRAPLTLTGLNVGGLQLNDVTINRVEV